MVRWVHERVKGGSKLLQWQWLRPPVRLLVLSYNRFEMQGSQDWYTPCTVDAHHLVLSVLRASVSGSLQLVETICTSPGGAILICHDDWAVLGVLFAQFLAPSSGVSFDSRANPGTCITNEHHR